MSVDADLDLLGVLVTRRDRLLEVADVLRRYRARAIRARRAGAPTAAARLRLAERVVRSARRAPRG